MNKIDNEGEPSTTVWQGPVVATNVLVAQETSILFPIWTLIHSSPAKLVLALGAERLKGKGRLGDIRSFKDGTFDHSRGSPDWMC